MTTIEGISDRDSLHPMQQAGQIMAAIACVAEGNASSKESISEHMSGNICRCGAYVGIVAAVETA